MLKNIRPGFLDVNMEHCRKSFLETSEGVWRFFLKKAVIRETIDRWTFAGYFILKVRNGFSCFHFKYMGRNATTKSIEDFCDCILCSCNENKTEYSPSGPVSNHYIEMDRFVS